MYRYVLIHLHILIKYNAFSMYRYTDFEEWIPDELSYEYSYKMMKLVTQVLGQKAVVIDSDDLCKYPGTSVVNLQELSCSECVVH